MRDIPQSIENVEALLKSENYVCDRSLAAGYAGQADLFSDEFMIRCPLLEALSEFQVTIPELGTIKAAEAPIVILTSNRTRKMHDALPIVAPSYMA